MNRQDAKNAKIKTRRIENKEENKREIVWRG
jgi:hypothetical protein